MSKAGAPALVGERAYDALRHGVLGRVIERDVVVVDGPDAATWLQGQCSQDLALLEVGDSVWTLLLSPQGKIAALARVHRAAPERFVFDAESGTGDAVEARLARFKLRVKVALEQGRWPCVELRGPAARDGAPPDAPGVRRVVAWPDLGGLDVLGADALPPGVPRGEAGVFECARIEAGLPAFGREFDEDTIPQSVGVTDAAVSFTKGCYTGQELVARLDARGNRVPNVLRGVEVDDSASPGDELVADERVLGRLTSAARSPRTGGTVALALVRREVEVPTTIELRRSGGSDSDPRPASVRALPLVAPLPRAY